jgi:hypothetical protein
MSQESEPLFKNTLTASMEKDWDGLRKLNIWKCKIMSGK